MKILYIGQLSSDTTSGHRFRALERLGHQVEGIDLHAILKEQLSGRIRAHLHFRTGYRMLQPMVQGLLRKLMSKISRQPDVVWVNSGELLGPNAVRLLRELGAPVILYNNDDPTSGRDKGRWGSLMNALPEYDFGAVRLDSNSTAFMERGLKRLMPVWMAYDEIAHAPNTNFSESDEVDVGFVGTWMRGEHRENLLNSLHHEGFRVSITGIRWQKCSNPTLVNECWAGSAISGREYVDAISRPKLTLGLVSKTNGDFHTTRSLEIPYAGGILFAERTDDHLRLYRENEEAVFWSTPEECVENCRRLLQDPEKRTSIRTAGMRRVRELGLGNEAVCRSILESCLNGTGSISRMSVPLHEI